MTFMHLDLARPASRIFVNFLCNLKLFVCFFPTVNRACLKFRYHMLGSGMGLLTVKISRDSRKPKEIWQAYGDHGDQWVKAKVTLKSSVKFQVSLCIH